MVKKGLLIALVTVTTICFQNSSNAFAPVINDPGDVVVGDAEGGANDFHYPDAFNLNDIVSDDFTSDSLIKWSYAGQDATYTINGATPLDLLAPDDPNNPAAGQRIDMVNLDQTTTPTEDGDPYTVTFRNEALSPIAGGPYGDPGVVGIVTSQTKQVTLFASDCSTFSARTITVFTDNDSSDRLSGGGVEFLFEDDFENDPNTITGWIGGVLGGVGQTSTNGGLCMGVPLTGDNQVGWLSPQPYVDMVDQAFWEFVVTMGSDANQDGSAGVQIPISNTPLWNFVYNNAFAGGTEGNNFAGEAWVLDTQGGAVSIGAAPGRTSFNFYAAPAGALTDQWRGMAGNPTEGIMTPAYDAKNDIIVVLRILDFDGAGVLAEQDTGQLCVQKIRVSKGDLTNLSTTPLWNPPINSATHAAQTNVQAGELGSASIDDGLALATYQLTTDTNGNRKTLLPFDPLQATFNEQLYPVVISSDTLYIGKATVRSDVNGGAGPEGTDPVDLVSVLFDTPTVELGQVHLVTRGNPGNFDLAGSPRLTPATYIGLFYSQTASLAGDIGNGPSDRFRAMVDFFNVLQISGNGADPVAVTGLAVERVNNVP